MGSGCYWGHSDIRVVADIGVTAIEGSGCHWGRGANWGHRDVGAVGDTGVTATSGWRLCRGGRAAGVAVGQGVQGV